MLSQKRSVKKGDGVLEDGVGVADLVSTITQLLTVGEEELPRSRLSAWQVIAAVITPSPVFYVLFLLFPCTAPARRESVLLHRPTLTPTPSRACPVSLALSGHGNVL